MIRICRSCADTFSDQEAFHQIGYSNECGWCAREANRETFRYRAIPEVNDGVLQGVSADRILRTTSDWSFHAERTVALSDKKASGSGFYRKR